MKKQEITIWIRNENNSKEFTVGKTANFENLVDFFNKNGRISFGWETMEDSLKKNEELFFDIRQGDKTIKSIKINLDMFRKKRGFFR